MIVIFYTLYLILIGNYKTKIFLFVSIYSHLFKKSWIATKLNIFTTPFFPQPPILVLLGLG